MSRSLRNTASFLLGFAIVCLIAISPDANAYELADGSLRVDLEDIYLLILAGLCAFAWFKGFQGGQQR